MLGAKLSGDSSVVEEAFGGVSVAGCVGIIEMEWKVDME